MAQAAVSRSMGVQPDLSLGALGSHVCASFPGAAPRRLSNSRKTLSSGNGYSGPLRLTETMISKSISYKNSRHVVCKSLGERTDERQSEVVDGVIQQRTDVSSTLASRWREIQGANDWKGLLDPLDMDLRRELIRYGEFAQSCYDAFDGQLHSKYKGSCFYKKEKMLQKVGLPDTGYEITDYLFATTSVDSFLLRNDAPDAWSRSSNWVGYIAVCTDEKMIKKMGRRDIVLAWRGTATKLEWAANLSGSMAPDALDVRSGDSSVPWNERVKIFHGFLNLYTTANSRTRYNQASVRDQVLTEIRRLVTMYDNEDLSITITGHSLGGAMSVLSAYDIVMSGVNRHGVDVDFGTFGDSPTIKPTLDPKKKGMVGRKIPVTAFTFAGPRVGNNPFAGNRRCSTLSHTSCCLFDYSICSRFILSVILRFTI